MILLKEHVSRHIFFFKQRYVNMWSSTQYNPGRSGIAHKKEQKIRLGVVHDYRSESLTSRRFPLKIEQN